MKLKAFSLLEFVIVFGVLAVLMGLGWTGLINFRSTAEMQNAYSELVSVIKTEQNKAKNSVSSNNDGGTPHFYTLFFIGNKYYAFNCGNSVVPLSSSSSSITCTKDSTVLFRILPANIIINPDPQCAGLGFAKLTGKFTSFTLPIGYGSLDTVTSFGTTYSQSGTCNIKISHTLISTQKAIEVNLNQNNLNVK